MDSARSNFNDQNLHPACMNDNKESQKHSGFFDGLHTVKTGDVMLFSGNSPTGFLLRTFTSSEYNHSGIAVRFVTDENGKKIISLTEEGELYILETNTGTRHDEIFGSSIVGVGFSKCDWVIHKYNKIAVRRLHPQFRNSNLSDLTLKFSDEYRGKRFPSTSLPFIGVWLGIPLTQSDSSSNEMFCSELMAYYYSYCIGPQYESITGFPFNGKLITLFGSDAPKQESMFTPGHYTSDKTPNASIFLPRDEIVYTVSADILYVILQPLLLILFFMLILWMSLPH